MLYWFSYDLCKCVSECESHDEKNFLIEILTNTFHIIAENVFGWKSILVTSTRGNRYFEINLKCFIIYYTLKIVIM